MPHGGHSKSPNSSSVTGAFAIPVRGLVRRPVRPSLRSPLGVMPVTRSERVKAVGASETWALQIASRQ